MNINIFPNPSDKERLLENYFFDDLTIIRRFNTSATSTDVNNRKINPQQVYTLIGQLLKWKSLERVKINLQTMNVIDGQHRVLAFIKNMERGNGEGLYLEVQFLNISYEKELEMITDLNRYNDNWKMTDYIQKGVQSGLKPFIDFVQFAENTPLCHSTDDNGKKTVQYVNTARCLYGKRVDAGIKGLTLELTKEQLTFGAKVANEINQILNLTGYEVKNNWIEQPIGCWHKKRKDNAILFDSINFNIFLDELRRYFKTETPVVTDWKTKDWNNFFEDQINILKTKYNVEALATASAHAA